MKAHELRVGNIVRGIVKKRTRTIITADKIIVDSILDLGRYGGKINHHHDTWLLDLENIQPIELTEEWLKDFGYENWGIETVNEYEKYQRFVKYNFVDGTSNHEVHIITSTYGDTNHIEYVTSIDKDERQYNGRMEFVHDLQNAVYKETGKELEYKPL